MLGSSSSEAAVVETGAVAEAAAVAGAWGARPVAESAEFTPFSTFFASSALQATAPAKSGAHARSKTGKDEGRIGTATYAAGRPAGKF
jgi:hypothetical protein